MLDDGAEDAGAGFQLLIRPSSGEVVPIQARRLLAVVVSRVSWALMPPAGLPAVWSRTWVVMGSFWDIVFWLLVFFSFFSSLGGGGKGFFGTEDWTLGATDDRAGMWGICIEWEFAFSCLSFWAVEDVTRATVLCVRVETTIFTCGRVTGHVTKWMAGVEYPDVSLYVDSTLCAIARYALADSLL